MALIGAELLAGLFAICAATYLVTGAWRPTGMSVHPFWLLVLLFAARYGLGPGLAAAGLSGALVLSATGTADPGLYARLADDGLLPLTWAGAALLVGGLRDRQTRKMVAQEHALQQALDDRAKVERWATEIERANAHLRARLEGLE